VRAARTPSRATRCAFVFRRLRFSPRVGPLDTTRNLNAPYLGTRGRLPPVRCPSPRPRIAPRIRHQVKFSRSPSWRAEDLRTLVADSGVTPLVAREPPGACYPAGTSEDLSVLLARDVEDASYRLLQPTFFASTRGSSCSRALIARAMRTVEGHARPCDPSWTPHDARLPCEGPAPSGRVLDGTLPTSAVSHRAPPGREMRGRIVRRWAAALSTVCPARNPTSDALCRAPPCPETQEGTRHPNHHRRG